jgi:hypothetical protein
MHPTDKAARVAGAVGLARLLAQLSPLTDTGTQGTQVNASRSHALDVPYFTIGVPLKLDRSVEGTRKFGLQPAFQTVPVDRAALLVELVSATLDFVVKRNISGVICSD